jgi:hypothetical protein
LWLWLVLLKMYIGSPWFLYLSWPWQPVFLRKCLINIFSAAHLTILTPIWIYLLVCLLRHWLFVFTPARAICKERCQILGAGTRAVCTYGWILRPGALGGKERWENCGCEHRGVRGLDSLGLENCMKLCDVYSRVEWWCKFKKSFANMLLSSGEEILNDHTNAKHDWR